MQEEWINKLMRDLVAINIKLKKERAKVNDGIQKLKALEKQRENLLDLTLGEENEQDNE